MSLFLLLYKQEVVALMRSLRFLLSLGIVLGLFIVGSRSFADRYAGQLRAYEKSCEREAQLRREASGNLTRVANRVSTFHFPPRLDGFLSGCRDEAGIRRIEYSAWEVGRFHVGRSVRNPLLEEKGLFDWTWIVSVFLSFVILLFAYDAVCGARRDRLLAYLFSYPVSRGVYLASKLAALVSVGFCLLLAGMLAGVLSLGGLPAGWLDGAMAAELLLFAGAGLLSLLLFAAFGLCVSVAVEHSNVSLLLCVGFWFFSAVVLPNSVVFWADRLVAVPSMSEVRHTVKAVSDSLHFVAPPGSQSRIGGEERSSVYNRRRAELYMDILREKRRIVDRHTDRLFRQFEITRGLMLLSPSLQYERAMEALVGGGYLRFRHNWKELHSFRQRFEAWFKAKDAQDPSSPHWYTTDYYDESSMTQQPVPAEEIPVYAERGVPIGERLLRLSAYAGATLAMTAGLWLLSLGLFRRQI